jgi:uncharacterized membrane protein
MKAFLEKIRTLFLSGLFALLPITLTITLLHFSFTLLKKWLDPLIPFMPSWLQSIPHAEFILAILFIFIFGAILRSFFINSVIEYFESIITSIPLIKPIYANMKQLVRAFSMDKNAFKKVVLVEFPRKGSYSIGFLTGQLPNSLAPEITTPVYNIFIPTTPNPTSGFYLIVAESEFITINLSSQEAMALIMSGGIIIPDRFIQQ